MKKIYLYGIIAVLLIAIAYPHLLPSPDESIARADIAQDRLPATESESEILLDGEQVAIDPTQSEIMFEGFKPGGSHVGTFEDWEGYFVVEDGEIIGLYGLIQVDSVKTDNERVDAHLKNDDFFDVPNYPTIEFTGTLENGVMSGPLTFHGRTHDISFPVTLGEESLQAEFVLDTTPFEFKYTGVNKEVTIGFDFAA